MKHPLQMFKAIIVVLLINSLSSFGQTSPKTVELTDNFDQLVLSNEYVEFLEDPTNQLTIETLLENPSSYNFKRTKKETVVIENLKSTYWVRIKIKNLSTKKKWLMENPDSHIDDFTSYAIRNDGTIIKNTAGYGLDFDIKPFNHKNFIFDIYTNYGEETTIYLRGKSSFHNPFFIYFRSLNTFIDYALTEYVVLGIFYGVLLIMIIYNLILFFSVKERIYLYYCLNVFSALLVSLTEDGLGFQYLWPHFPSFNVILFNYAPILYVVSFILYSRSFLEIKKYAPNLEKMILGIGGLFVLYFLAKNSGINLPWNTSLYIIPFIFIYYVAFIARKNNIKLANYFIVANTILIFSLLVTFCRMSGLIRSASIYTVYSFNIGLLLEIVLFSFMMSERFRLVKKEKETYYKELIDQLEENGQLKDKVNRELEEKVAERTKELAESNQELNIQKEELESANEMMKIQAEELETANEHLKLQADEITRMNLILKKENVDLHTNVVELARARVMVKDVNFEEFSKIFPDSDSCLTYLSSLKWKNGYTCRKCGNNKHVATDDGHSYRCTKCRYNESAMAYSIFHKCKFPLNKAFYILFLIYASKDKITSQELSDVLDLRLSTCWHFSKKVKEAMGSKSRIAAEKEGLEGWAALIPTEEE